MTLCLRLRMPTRSQECFVAFQAVAFEPIYRLVAGHWLLDAFGVALWCVGWPAMTLALLCVTRCKPV